jgi:hypothetical protein
MLPKGFEDDFEIEYVKVERGFGRRRINIKLSRRMISRRELLRKIANQDQD